MKTRPSHGLPMLWLMSRDENPLLLDHLSKWHTIKFRSNEKSSKGKHFICSRMSEMPEETLWAGSVGDVSALIWWSRWQPFGRVAGVQKHEDRKASHWAGRCAGIHHSKRSLFGSGKLAGICKWKWKAAFMSYEFAAVVTATLPATRPPLLLTCWLVSLGCR